MKSELRLRHHLIRSGERVIEVWWQGELVATVTGADGPGVRVISKHDMVPEKLQRGVVEVKVRKATL